MARVVIVTNGIASTSNAGLELARRLVDRGHRVAFVCHVDIGPAVEAHGHEFVRLTADRDGVAEIRATVSAARRGSLRAALTLPRIAWRARRRTLDASELHDTVRALRPDALVIDTEAHVAIIGTSDLGVPTLLTTFLFGVVEAAGLPPIGSRLTPDRTVEIRTEWDALRREHAGRRRRRRWSRRGLVDRLAPIAYGTTSHVALAPLARRHGFDLAARTDPDQWLRPHVYVDLPTLSTNLWELEFDHDPPPNWTYVGPMTLPVRTETRWDDIDRATWDRCRARRDERRPLVYASLGSYWRGDADLLGRIVDAARLLPGVDLVIGLGAMLERHVLEPVPDNVFLLGWAPQVEILERARAAIVHGGNAALNECVVAAVPMLVYSTGHLDQDGVAARIAAAGIGVLGDARRDRPAVIADRLRTVLDDPVVRANCNRLSELARDPERQSLAPQLIERAIAG